MAEIPSLMEESKYFCELLSSISLILATHLAKLILAFCPPLKETPRSPTNVKSPFSNVSKS